MAMTRIVALILAAIVALLVIRSREQRTWLPLTPDLDAPVGKGW